METLHQMTRILLILRTFLALTGRKTIRILSAKDHKPKNQSPESISRFAKEMRIETGFVPDLRPGDDFPISFATDL